jgi:hypothetical protein
MPNLIQLGMKADTEAAINALGKNEQVKKVFWTVFVGIAGACKKSHIYYKFIHKNAITHRPTNFNNSKYRLAVDSF